jgi:hypothetical protein
MSMACRADYRDVQRDRRDICLGTCPVCPAAKRALRVVLTRIDRENGELGQILRARYDISAYIIQS